MKNNKITKYFSSKSTVIEIPEKEKETKKRKKEEFNEKDYKVNLEEFVVSDKPKHMKTDVPTRIYVDTENEYDNVAYFELIAKKIKKVHEKDDIDLVLDNEFAYKVFTNLFQLWEKNGWKKKDGSAVKNQDIIKKVLGLIRCRKGITNFSILK